MSDAINRPGDGVNIGRQTGTGYIWLAYSAFFFIDPFLRHERRYWLQNGAIYLFFLAVYIGYMRARTMSQRYFLLGVFYLLGALVLPFNEGASSFFFYVSAFLPFVVRSAPLALGLIAATSLAFLAEDLWVHSHPLSTALIGFFMAVVGTANFFMAQQKRADSRLRMANDEIERLAALAERERIARDLHDVLGHTLSVIVLKAELAGRLIERDPGRASAEIADVEKTARTALSEVRQAIGGYRSQGLHAEMELARRTLDSAGVAFSCESVLPQLNAAEETVLCLAVREAVTNVVRHARATHCRMSFGTSGDGAHTLLIADDGRHSLVQEGNGLRGMRERVQALGGSLSITSSPGFTLRIELPQMAPGGGQVPCVL